MSESPTERVARLGLVARGVLYALLGLLAARIAVGDGSESADSQGAIDTLSRQPFGRLLLLALALGFAGYAFWRFAVAWTDDALGERLRGLGSGLLWTALALGTLRHVFSGGGPSNAEESLTARLLGLPFGVPLVVVVGLAVVVVGLDNGREAVTGDWREDLRLRGVSAARRRVVAAVAVGGLAGRLAVFTVTGGFLVRAALQHDPDEGVGLDGALREAAARPYGPWILGALALGLLTYAVWCAVRARFEHVDPG